MNDLYRNAAPNVSAGFSFDDEVLKAALKRIYSKDFNPMTELEENLFNEFWSKLNEATETGFNFQLSIFNSQLSTDPDDDFHEALRHNNGVFAAFKTHRMQNDIAAQLLDENGNLKPFEQWLNDVQPIADHQIYQWFRTEYDTAVKRAHLAAEWKQFEREADVLPNLEWIPSTSITPGADHQVYWETIRPINDPFWEQHKPGDRWGCKCGLRSTDKEPTPMGDIATGKKDNPAPGLDNNPGKDGILFSDTHPYNPPNCAACNLPGKKRIFTGKWTGFFNKGKKDCYNCSRPKELMKHAGTKIPNKMEIEAIKQEYNSLNPDVWKKEYFDKENGGFLAIEHKRIRQAKKSKNELAKYEKEYAQCITLAKSGHKVKFIDDSNGGFDIYMDEIAAELKKLSSSVNLTDEAKDAIYNKKAKLVVFEFEKESKSIYTELSFLAKKGIHGKYWFKGRETKIYDF